MATILITGGTGLVGSALTEMLLSKGYEVIILTRDAVNKSASTNVSYASWNIDEQRIDGDAIGKADYIIHLAGAGVMDKNWTSKYKQEIVESRTRSSELLIKGLKENTHKVKAVISASAIGWYGESRKGAKPFVEKDPADSGFLGQTCKLWEESLEPVITLGIRLVKLRLGIVLSRDGGALEEFKKPLRYGIAGIMGGGNQVISWVHIADVCRLFIYALTSEGLEGSFNAVSPEPVTNKKLTLELAKLVRKRFFVPVHIPKFALHLLLGQRSIEILKSASVSDDKIRNEGFTFHYPGIESALKDLV